MTLSSLLTYMYIYIEYSIGSLVPAMCNRTSCAHVHELPQSQIIVVITGRAHCFHDCIYIYIYIYILTLSAFVLNVKYNIKIQ